MSGKLFLGKEEEKNEREKSINDIYAFSYGSIFLSYKMREERGNVGFMK